MKQDGIRFTREYFISALANVLVIKLSANKKAALNFSLSLNRPEKFETTASGNELVMKGALYNGQGGKGNGIYGQVKDKTNWWKAGDKK